MRTVKESTMENSGKMQGLSPKESHDSATLGNITLPYGANAYLVMHRTQVCGAWCN